MPQSLVEGLKSFITPQLIAPLAAKLGESEQSVHRGIETGSAAILTALASRASESGFMNTIANLITGSGAQMAKGAVAGAGQADGGATSSATNFLGTILGSSQSAVLDSVAKSAGLRTSSASEILGAAAPIVMGLLGQRMSAGNLGAGALGSLLTAELPRLQGLLPSGFPSLASAKTLIPDNVETGGKSWLWPLLLIAALLAVGLYWFLGRGTTPATDIANKVTDTATSATSAVTDAAKTAVSALGEFFKRKLPDGVELNIPQNGVENKLIAFIDDKSKAVDKTTWFDFDRLLFDTGKSTLQASSNEQLQNVAAILKAYPAVKIKIGGYTDNTGSSEGNMKLSNDRASTVMNQLASLGVEPSRLTAEGYGDQHPVADNSTEEGRARNRRISMRVTEK